MNVFPVRLRRSAALLALLLFVAPSVSLAQSPQPPQKGIVERTKEGVDRAADKIDDAVKRAADIFKRVPCASRDAYLEGSLPGIAKKLIAGKPVTMGSSASIGFGLWHLFVPRMWRWYSYIDPSATELVLAVRAINVFFSLSLVLFGLLNVLFVWGGKANRYSILSMRAWKNRRNFGS